MKTLYIKIYKVCIIRSENIILIRPEFGLVKKVIRPSWD